jgi:hypothetical protein
MKTVLHDIVNGLENLSVSLDALEAALIRKGQLTTGEIAALSPLHVAAVTSRLVALRGAIDSLPE